MGYAGRAEVFDALGLQDLEAGVHDGNSWTATGPEVEVRSPIDGSLLGRVRQGSPSDYQRVVSASAEAFAFWRQVPAPQRGEVVRQLGDELRRLKEPLGRLVTMEMGKCLREGLGEVQEMIDI